MAGDPSTRADARRVWVVDDNPLELEHSCRVLAAEYAVERFTDGSAVLERLAAGEGPDVLVLDWIMPGVTGTDVCRFIRNSPSTAETPVLLLTAQRETAQIVEGLRAGANDYLAKPYAPEEMRARVAGLVRSRALREQLDRASSSLRTLLAALPEAVLLVNPRGLVAFANDEASRVFSRAGRPLTGRPLGEVLPELSVDPARQLGGTAEPLADLTLGDCVYSPLVRPLVQEDGISLAVSLRDVTSKRQREARRLDFYAMVAHDLRSPLSAMLMRVEWLMAGRRGELPADARADLHKVEARIHDLVAMINDFLDVARIEAAGVELRAERLDLNAVARAAVEEYHGVAVASRLSLRLEPAPEPGWVEGDRARLGQVLANLLSNAIKFTASGGEVTVRVLVEGERVATEVEDTGRGIPPQVVPHLFQPYVRGKDVPREIAGTGLGLMIVRELVEAHGGSVAVRSEVGKGSVFRVELARVGAPAAVAAKPAAKS